VVYLLGTTQSPGGYIALRYQGSTWVNDGIAGACIAAGPAGVRYAGRDATGQYALEQRIPSVSPQGSPAVLPTAAAPVPAPNSPTAPPGTITINQPTVGIPIGTLTPPAAPPNAPLYVTGLGYNPTPASVKLIAAYQYVYTPGKLVCSDPESMGAWERRPRSGWPINGRTLQRTCIRTRT
jgi:hypothetical protein